MGQSQTNQALNNLNIHALFPNIKQYKPVFSQGQANINHCQHSQQPMYKNEENDKIALIKNFEVTGQKKSAVQAYYLNRIKLPPSPHIHELVDMKLTFNKSSQGKNQSTDLSSASNLCSLKMAKNNQNSSQIYTLWLFVETSTICLQDQIVNRANKKPFEEIQLWSLLSSCILGALNLLNHGCKQPVLSPKGIGLTKEGVVKIGEWEFVSKINRDYITEQGQIIFGKMGQPVSEVNKNSLNQLLLNYYWAPEGLRAMQNFITLGQKQSKMNNHSHRNSKNNQNLSQKFQIFSLGMTVISMCLRNCYYRTDTFSEKYLLKLINQAIQIRKVQGKQLSAEMKHIIESMVKWDPSERISYIQLRDLILQYFSQHPEQMKSSSISVKTFSNSSMNDLIPNNMIRKGRTRSQASNISMNLTQEHSFIDSYTFALAEAGLKVNYNLKKEKQKIEQQQNSQNTMSSGFQITSGSGMIEQGPGDNDQNLQQKQENIAFKQVINQIREQQISSQPITHRTQNALKQKAFMPQKNNSPYILIQKQSENVSPNAEVKKQSVYQIQKYNEKKQNKQKQNLAPKIGKNQVYLKQSSFECFKLKQRQIQINKLNYLQVYKQKNSRNGKNEPVNSFRIALGPLKIETNMADESGKQRYEIQERGRYQNPVNSNSHRGSYRCSNKEQPKINSGRYKDQLYTFHAVQITKSIIEENRQVYNSHTCSHSSNGNANEKASGNPISNDNVNMNKQKQYNISYSYSIQKLKPVQPSPQDQEDQIDFIYKFETCLQNQQLQNPDIFQTFQQSQYQISSQSSEPNPNYNEIAYQNKQLSYNSSQVILPTQILKRNRLEVISNNQKNTQSQQLTCNKRVVIAKQMKNNTPIQSHNQQFMTFNSKQKSIQDNFQLINLVPSKWKKNQNYKQHVFTQKIDDNSNQNLFTDPKLLEYIRSPVGPSVCSSIQSTSKYDSNDQRFGQKLPKVSAYEQFQQRNKQNITNFLNKGHHKINGLHQQNEQNYVDKQNISSHNNVQHLQNTSNQVKIVKQKFSRGFYQGQKKNGMRSGYGVFYYNQGGKYKGNWFNNQMHGKGTLEYSDGRIAYQGDWHCDQLHGKGILYNQSPNFVSGQLNYQNLDELDQCWIFYEGTFQNDDKSGMGLLVLSNHEQFIGQFKNDMAEGYGQYLKSDGSIVKGIWSKNRLVKIMEQ